MQTITKKKIIILFLGNIHHDSRCNNLYHSLSKKNNNVKVISCDWLANKNEISDTIKIHKIKKGKLSFLFYFKAYLIFTKELFISRIDYCFAEDVFTLPIAAIFKYFKGFKLIYDSRELYPFLAGLKDKKINQYFIQLIEKFFIASSDKVLTTGKMDKEFLENYYKLNNVEVLRNLPLKQKISPVNLRQIFKINNSLPILIYQGVLLEGRGIPLIIKALEKTNNFNFLILGDGPFKKYLEKMASTSSVSSKIIFAGRIPLNELLNYTAGANIGLAVIENLSKSYYYALPNKLFEYIIAGLPVIISPLPQMVEIVNKYNVGEVLNSINPQTIAETINRLISNPDRLRLFKDNALKAAEELNWEEDFNKITF